ncbi:hypothetical protein QKT49_gp201 [Acanthamoeba castellanii medusavirus]|uniref:Uncharacterized protein n=1 Tax=Acanthamoeba castellanii medusavirus J1 TaxID=3114988 RepID=A0A3T1CXJ5_9VIRU|nr:hypothetical protein QKT49_gp201 [Acanthamoeba castellanii medusavirus]BBI30562.1 hypothetical protein [Acanthamoeba castellanii medusavirus J1]
MSELLKKSLFEWYAEKDPRGVRRQDARWTIVWEMNAQLQPVSLRLLDWLVTNYAKEHRVYYMNTCEEGTAAAAAAAAADPFDVHTSYRSWLKSYRKTNFDPFRRGKRFYFDGQRERPDWAERCAHLKASRDGIVASLNELRDELERLRIAPAADKDEERETQLEESVEEKEKELDKTITEIAGLKIMRTTVGQLNFFRWAISRGVFDWASAHRTEIEADMARKSASHRRTTSQDEEKKRKSLSIDDDANQPIRLGEPATAERVQRLMNAIVPATAATKRRKLSASSSSCRSKGDAPQPILDSCIVFRVGTSVSFLNHRATKPF